MAQRMILVDDIDETEGDDVETVLFGLHGATYEVDLNSKNQKRLEEALAPFLGAARKAERSASQSTQQKARAAAHRDYEPKVVREWAQGKPEYKDIVPPRGRIPLTVLDAWRKEQK